jgi:hypothetical protein
MEIYMHLRPSLVAAFFVLAAAAQTADVPQFTASGELVRPVDYREWVFLSSGLGMTYGPIAEANPEHPMFDNVFVNRSAYRKFLETGKWPDKTMFVLEVRDSKSKESINNGGRFQSDVRGIEAEVKDGGKWTFYGLEGKSGKAIPRTARCYSCHAENGAVDNTFVQFYPTLVPIARQKGSLK